MDNVVRLPGTGMTTGEVAGLLRLTEKTVKLWVKKGIIPRKCYWKTEAGRLLFDRESIDEWMKMGAIRDNRGKLFE